MERNEYFSCMDLLIKINRRHKKLIDRSISTEIGLHRTQHIILMKLSDQGTLPSQKDLAEHIGVSAAAISGALKKLEDDGYIERKIGEDNRFNKIEITERGIECVSKTKKIFAEIDKSMFDGFDKSELELLIQLLERMNNNAQFNRED